MKDTALIMAGGSGARMSSSGVAIPKPLVPILGVPVLERNLLTILGAGLKSVAISVPAGSRAVLDFASTRCRRICEALGAELELIEEEKPLGNVGSVGFLSGLADRVLVVFADNLTSLSLLDMLENHSENDADLTLATHFETQRLEWGAVEVEGSRVVRYREKPSREVRVSSGVYVLGEKALASANPVAPLGAAELVQRLIGSGAAVHAFHHDAAWIDINDARALGRAAELVGSHSPDFECWHPSPDLETVRVLAQQRSELLVKVCSSDRIRLGLPGTAVRSGESRHDALRRLAPKLTGGAVQAFVYDDIDLETGRVIRNHVYAIDAPGPCVLGTASEFCWVPIGEGPPENADASVLRGLSRSKGAP